MTLEENAQQVANAKAKKPNGKAATVLRGPDGVIRSAKGAIIPNLANVVRVFEMDPEWQKLRFNTFALRTECVDGSPIHPQAIKGARMWMPADDARACIYLQRNFTWQNGGPSTRLVAEAIEAYAHQREVHPPREYLDKCAGSYDGKQRLRTMLTTYFAVPDSEYVRCVGEMWMRSAVARVDIPGVKADHILILEGLQGARKSTGIKLLASEEWFCDSLPDLGSKDAAMQLAGHWIIEVAELDAMTRAEASTFKAFAARTTDTFRPPYGVRTVEVPRQCVFAGTTNKSTYLIDETGNRRVWPVTVAGKVDVDAIARDRDQLWGEAVISYREGKPWWFESEAMASTEQDKRFQVDAWEPSVLQYINRNSESGVTVGGILGAVFLKEAKDWTRADQMRVSSILQRAGWTRRQVRDQNQQREWRYFPCGEEPAE